MDFRLDRLCFCVECLWLRSGESAAAPARFVSSLSLSAMLRLGILTALLLPFSYEFGILVSVVYISIASDHAKPIRSPSSRGRLLIVSILHNRMISLFFCAFHLDTVETRKNNNYFAGRILAAIFSLTGMYVHRYKVV